MTNLDIANRGIIKIGQAEIASFNDSNPDAMYVWKILNMVRRELLSSYTWLFAIKRAILEPTKKTQFLAVQDEADWYSYWALIYWAADPSKIPADIYSDVGFMKFMEGHPYSDSFLVPPFEYKYSYTVPEDFLRLVKVYIGNYAPNTITTFGAEAQYSLEGTQILTNQAYPLNIIYLADIEEPDMYPPFFCEAMSCKIAYELCEKFAASSNKKTVLFQEYQLCIKNARRNNIIQLPPVHIGPTSWVGRR